MKITPSGFRDGALPPRLYVIGLLTVLIPVHASADTSELSFEQVVLIATNSDLTLAGQRDEMRAAISGASAEADLPPPILGLKLANVPVDSFRFNQEPMTQAMISYTQKLPAKGLLKSRKNELLKKASTASTKSLLRRAQLRKEIAMAWVRGWQAEQVIKIIARHRGHFEQMVRSAEANYRAGLRRASQRDVLALRTSLTRLDNRSLAASTRSVRARESMREWLDDTQLKKLDFDSASSFRKEDFWSRKTDFSSHPAVLMNQELINQATATIGIATAMTGPNRTLSLSYGYREDSDSGVDREDFISLGFSTQLPGLRGTANRARIQASQIKRGKASRDKQLVELQLRSEYQSTIEINAALEQQLLTYTQRLMPLSVQQTKSTLGAYTSGETPFMTMQRTQIELMNVELEQIDLQAELSKNAVNLSFLSTNTPASTKAK